MSCIVGLVDGDAVLIGADSLGSNSYSCELRLDPKVFRNGPYLIGFSTSFRMGQLLRYAFKAPAPPSKIENLEEHMATTFVDAVRSCLKAGGYAEKTNEVEHGGQFLVGVRGKLFSISNDYQVGEPLMGFTSIGSGYQFALGSLASTATVPKAFAGAEDRVRAALMSAETFNPYVRGPYTILRLAS